MEDKVFMCTIRDLKDNKYFIKWIEKWKDELIVFFNKSNDITIKSSICPHFGGEVIYDYKKDRLKCLWHDWEFCPKSGKCLTYPIKGILNPYDFEVDPNPLKSYKVLNRENKIYAIKK
jgi:nitrite reductase/ring-hydroxylating ferredoxin subunit